MIEKIKNIVFLRFVLSSGTSFILDMILFQFFVYIFKNSFSQQYIFLATLCARIFSSVYNYLVNKIFVFEEKGSGKKSSVKYFVLCITQLLMSANLVKLFYSIFLISEVVIKFFVDVCLFVISFFIQKMFVFTK